MTLRHATDRRFYRSFKEAYAMKRIFATLLLMAGAFPLPAGAQAPAPPGGFYESPTNHGPSPTPLSDGAPGEPTPLAEEPTPAGNAPAPQSEPATPSTPAPAPIPQ